MESLQTIRRELRMRQVTVWQGKQDSSHEHIKDILVVVDEKTGKITEYKKTSESIHDGIKSGDCDAETMYGCNGFERARLFEDAAVAHQDEEVL